MDNPFPALEPIQEPDDAQGEAGSLIVFDLRQLARFREDEPYIQVLSDLGAARLILFGFKAGQQLKDHRTTSQILVQVLRGRVVFNTAGNSVLLQAGKVIQLEANIVHNIIARTDAIMLLTMISNSTQQQTVPEPLLALTPLVTRVTNN